MESTKKRAKKSPSKKPSSWKPDHYREDSVIAAALEEYISSNREMSFRKLAQKYGVPRATLHNRFKGAKNGRDSHSTQQKLTPEEEDILMEYVRSLSVNGLLPCKAVIEKLARQVLRARFNKLLLQGEPPAVDAAKYCHIGGSWFDHFVSRHKNDAIVDSTFGLMAKNVSITRDKIATWFDYLEKVVKSEFITSDVFFALDIQKYIYTVVRGRFDGDTTSGEPFLEVSALEAISGAGDVFRPTVVFGSASGKTGADVGLVEDLSVNGELAFRMAGESPLGSDDVMMFFEANKAILQSKGPKNKLLLCEGFDFITSLDFLDYCRANNIILFLLPATHSYANRLNPLKLNIVPTIRSKIAKHLGGINQKKSSSKVDATATEISEGEWCLKYAENRLACLASFNPITEFHSAGLIPIAKEEKLKELFPERVLSMNRRPLVDQIHVVLAGDDENDVNKNETEANLFAHETSLKAVEEKTQLALTSEAFHTGIDADTASAAVAVVAAAAAAASEDGKVDGHDKSVDDGLKGTDDPDPNNLFSEANRPDIRFG